MLYFDVVKYVCRQEYIGCVMLQLINDLVSFLRLGNDVFEFDIV